MVVMGTAFRLAGSLLALAVLAAPVAGMCAALASAEDSCDMRESVDVVSCGHTEMVMTACCAADSVDPAAAGILPGPAGDIDLPALAHSRLDAPGGESAGASAPACDGDPPPAVPRYRLFSALLL